MSKNELVVKSNTVIEASYRLSIIEQRVILAAITQIPKNQEITDDEIYFVSIAQLQQLGVHEKRAYQDLEEGVSRLYKRSITLIINNKSEEFRWIQKIERIESKGQIGLRFSKDILPFISNLSREFTKYQLSDIAGISSAYGIRIYELITQYKNLGKREIAVTDLRNMLEIGTRYPLFADLKKRVVDVAINQINEHSPMQVSYELRKTGRKISHIIFNFNEKKENKIKDIKQNKDRDKDTPDLFVGLTDKQASFFASKIANDTEYQSLANIGEEMPQFIERIKSELMNENTNQKYIKALNKHGFK